jgi:phage protein D
MSGAGISLALPVPDWRVLYNGTDITRRLATFLSEITYEEAVGKQANSIEIVLTDALQQMQANPPTITDTIDLSLGYAGSALKSVGTFQIDEFGLKGPPDQFHIKAIQAGLTQALRTPNSAAYEGQTLLQIAGTVAARHGFTVVGDAVDPNVPYGRVTQALEPDLAFLHRLASTHNYEFNVRDNKLVFYSHPALEAVAPVGTISRTGVINFDFKNQTLGRQTYKAAQVSYFDPATKALVTGHATATNVPTADTLKTVERVENGQQAQLRAQAYLHEHNASKVTGEISLPGTMTYRAGMTVNVSGFGTYDSSTYMIERAKHRLATQGWVTALSLHIVVTGTAAQTVGADITEAASSPGVTPGT